MVRPMRTPGGVLPVLFACWAAEAAAQAPPPEPVPPVPPVEPAEPAPAPEPPPAPPPPPPRRDPTPGPAAPDRPEGRTMAIGAGWNIGSQDLMVPNTASVRFRFPSGLTFEPSI